MADYQLPPCVEHLYTSLVLLRADCSPQPEVDRDAEAILARVVSDLRQDHHFYDSQKVVAKFLGLQKYHLEGILSMDYLLRLGDTLRRRASQIGMNIAVINTDQMGSVIRRSPEPRNRLQFDILFRPDLDDRARQGLEAIYGTVEAYVFAGKFR